MRKVAGVIRGYKIGKLARARALFYLAMLRARLTWRPGLNLVGGDHFLGPSTNRLRARTPRATITDPRLCSVAVGSCPSLSLSRARRACIRACVCRVVGGGDGGGIPMSVTTFRTGPGQLRGDRSRRRLRPGRRGHPGLAVVLVPLPPVTARMKARAASHRACASSSVRHDTTSLPFLSVFLALPTPPPSPPRSLRLPLIAIPARVGRTWRENCSLVAAH